MCLEFYQSLRNTQNSDCYIVFDLHSSLVILSHKWHNIQIVALGTLIQTQTFKNSDTNLVTILNIQQKYPANNTCSTQTYEVSCSVLSTEKTFLHAVSCHAIALTFSIKVSEETQFQGRTRRDKLWEWYPRADEDLIGASARKHQEENW